jgi:hypothetical protein
MAGENQKRLESYSQLWASRVPPHLANLCSLTSINLNETDAGSFIYNANYKGIQLNKARASGTRRGEGLGAVV